MKKTVIIGYSTAFLALALLGCSGGETDDPVADPSSPDPTMYNLGGNSSTTVNNSSSSADISSLSDAGENLCGIGYCVASWIGDGHCDWACNCIETEYDSGDCGIFLDTGTTTDVAVATDLPAGVDEGPATDEGSDTEEPPSDDGPQEDVSSEFSFPCNEFIPCAPIWAGDGLCDPGCNCEEANWDGGDCPIPE